MLLAGKNTIETVSRAEALQRTKHILKEINDVMIENYHDCDDHCTQALEGETFPGMVISPDVGGSQLRRSVWKKSPVWQFCTTNLNVHVMTWRKFSDGDVKSNAHLDLNVVPRARTSTASVISSRVVPEASVTIIRYLLNKYMRVNEKIYRLLLCLTDLCVYMSRLRCPLLRL